jgi:hypothetical protein
MDGRREAFRRASIRQAPERLCANSAVEFGRGYQRYEDQQHQQHWRNHLQPRQLHEFRCHLSHRLPVKPADNYLLQ